MGVRMKLRAGRRFMGRCTLLPHPRASERAMTRMRTKTMEEDEDGHIRYSPISPSPGILGRLSVDSSGGSRKPAHEQSKSDETTRKIAAAHAVALMQKNSFRKYLWMRESERGGQT
jgi:hypothetical protein